MEATRQLVGKRARGVGKLRPSVVLYNEMHKDVEGVGEAVRKDLVGGSKGKGRSGADLLLVVGTSLRVPGTKRIVREFAKAVHSRSSTAIAKDTTNPGLATPTPSPRRTPASDEEAPLKAVYLNFDFPVPTREWEGVFDAWIQGDAQTFADMLGQEIEKEAKAKVAAVEKKKKREEDALIASQETEGVEKVAGTKRKATSSKTSASSAKKRKLASSPPTPTSTKRKQKRDPVSIKGTAGRKNKQSSGIKTTKFRSKFSPSKGLLVPEVYIDSPAHRLPKPEPLDREDDLAKDPGGRWKRGPLILPGHSEVPPVVEQVDDYRSFKMFDAGWILPGNQKRGGRAAAEKTPLPPKRRSAVKAAPTPSATPVTSVRLKDNILLNDFDEDIIDDRTFSEIPGELPSSFLHTVA